MINVIENLEEYQKLKDKDYLKIFLRSVPIDIQEEMHNKYIEENLFNSEEIGENGVIGFLTAYSAKIGRAHV